MMTGGDVQSAALAEVPPDSKPAREAAQASGLQRTPPDPRPASRSERWTLLEVLRWTTKRFQDRGLGTPRLDAEILIAAALGLPRVQLYVQFDRPLDAAELARIRELVRRRQGGESVAYVVGHKEFFGLELTVDTRVLVPRPDTETLVDEVLARVRERSPATSLEAAPGIDGASGIDEIGEIGEIDKDGVGGDFGVLKIADVGTGSGAIAVTLAKHLPTAAVFATDLSPDALEVARANASRHGVAVSFFHGDLLAPLVSHAPLDVIAANLPYVPTRDIAGLAAEVRAEPISALDGGPDGLELVRRVIVEAWPLLTSGSGAAAGAGAGRRGRGGCLVLEIGAGQAEETAALCRQAGFIEIRSRRDLGEIDRVISAIKP